MSPPLAPIQSQIHSNVIFPSTLTFSEWPLPFRSSNQNFLRIPQLSHACYVSRPSHFPWFHYSNNIWSSVQAMKLLIMQSARYLNSMGFKIQPLTPKIFKIWHRVLYPKHHRLWPNFVVVVTITTASNFVLFVKYISPCSERAAEYETDLQVICVVVALSSENCYKTVSANQLMIVLRKTSSYR
jgi:hypothetical protein